MVICCAHQKLRENRILFFWQNRSKHGIFCFQVHLPPGLPEEERRRQGQGRGQAERVRGQGEKYSLALSATLPKKIWNFYLKTISPEVEAATQGCRPTSFLKESKWWISEMFFECFTIPLAVGVRRVFFGSAATDSRRQYKDSLSPSNNFMFMCRHSQNSLFPNREFEYFFLFLKKFKIHSLTFGVFFLLVSSTNRNFLSMRKCIFPLFAAAGRRLLLQDRGEEGGGGGRGQRHLRGPGQVGTERAEGDGR